MPAPTTGNAILLAALALPGVAVQAETAPDAATISLKYLSYRDWQAGLDRIAVTSPSVHLIAPLAGVWSLEGSLVTDTVSGASPRYHTAVSGASQMDDHRRGADLRVTRYFDNASVSAGAASSGERDYRSRAVSLAASLSSAGNNTTAGLSLGVANDTINPVNLAVENERRHTVEWMASLEQVLGRRDIVKLDFTHARGHGYYSDPYKYVDNRPRTRDQNSLLVRWNHSLDSTRAALRLSYRYYSDSYRIRAHMLGAEFEQSLAGGWSLTPSLRLYTQSAASFYFGPVYDPVFGPPFPPGFRFGATGFSSADQRLSAFDAATLGLRVEKAIGAGMTLQLKLERYRQRGGAGMAQLDARTLQAGLSKQW